MRENLLQRVNEAGSNFWFDAWSGKNSSKKLRGIKINESCRKKFNVYIELTRNLSYRFSEIMRILYVEYRTWPGLLWNAVTAVVFDRQPFAAWYSNP